MEPSTTQSVVSPRIKQQQEAGAIREHTHARAPRANQAEYQPASAPMRPTNPKARGYTRKYCLACRRTLAFFRNSSTLVGVLLDLVLGKHLQANWALDLSGLPVRALHGGRLCV